jgi:hypothetical protein
MSARIGRVAPLQIRSDQLAAVAGDRPGSGVPAFSAFPVEAAVGKPKRGHWRERDLRRAFAVARSAGLSNYRVEIAPDGTISIVVSDGKPRGRR